MLLPVLLLGLKSIIIPLLKNIVKYYNQYILHLNLGKFMVSESFKSIKLISIKGIICMTVLSFVLGSSIFFNGELITLNPEVVKMIFDHAL
jgi:hypothetical protein